MTEFVRRGRRVPDATLRERAHEPFNILRRCDARSGAPLIRDRRKLNVRCSGGFETRPYKAPERL